jgi:hypothetical protein
MGANQSIQQIRVSDADLASALAAVRREPFASGALTLIGIARDQRGDAANATRIVASAHALDKRQLVANAWLINRYGTAGRDREVLALLDEALKVRPELSDRYMPAFAQALQNSETVPVFQTLLSRHPAWEGDFWSAVALNRAALPNGEVLRSRLLASHHDLDSVDAMLMRAYIQAGRLDLAVSSGKNLPTLPEDGDNMIRNSSFSRTPILPPLDWELMNDGRISTTVDEASGRLEISALPGAGGVAARQLIALPPGNYALLVKLGQQALSSGSDVTAHLYCAEQGVQGASLNERLNGDLDRSFVVGADAQCRFYWIELIFSALDSSGPALASIAEVRIAHGRAPPSE